MDETREERIRRRAYELWQRDGQRHGRHEEHWRRAEAELGDGASNDQNGATVRREAPSDGSTAGERQYGDAEAPIPADKAEREPQPDTIQPDERPQTMAGALPIVRSRERAVKSRSGRSARSN